MTVHTPRMDHRTISTASVPGPLVTKELRLCAHCGAHFIVRRDTPANLCHNCQGAARGAAFLGLDPDADCLALAADEIEQRTSRYLAEGPWVTALWGGAR